MSNKNYSKNNKNTRKTSVTSSGKNGSKTNAKSSGKSSTKTNAKSTKKKKGGSSVPGIITLIIVFALLTVFVGWSSSWFTDWSFSHLTDTVTSIFQGDEPEDPDTEDPDTEDPDTEDPDTEDPDTEDPDTEDPGSSGSGDQSGDQSDDQSGGQTGDEEAATYTITWDGGSAPSGYTFVYDCQAEAKAGDAVTITISNTAGSDAAMYITVTDDSGSTVASGSLVFGDNTYTFVMPEGNVTVTYTITKTSSGGQTGDEEAATYTVIWGGGTAPSGYTFEYDCQAEAKAGDEVVITISMTNGNTASSNAAMYITVTDDSGSVVAYSGSLVFGDNTYTFTMPEDNVTITYKIVELSSGGAF